MATHRTRPLGAAGRAATRGPSPVAGDAAARPPGGTAPDDPTEWMGERLATPEDVGDAPQGVPVSTRTPGDTRRGQAVESKRGKR